MTTVQSPTRAIPVPGPEFLVSIFQSLFPVSSPKIHLTPPYLVEIIFRPLYGY